MAQFYDAGKGGPEDMVVCPYDNVHVIRQKRLPYHLMKCRKNHPNIRMKCCAFNARHEVPEAEYQYHMTTCPDRNVVERHILYNSPVGIDSLVKGNTDVPTYFPDVTIPDTGVDWDAEALCTPRIGVRPIDMAGVGYIKSTQGLTPSQKRQFHANLLAKNPEANAEVISSEEAVTVRPAVTIGRGRGVRLNKSDQPPPQPRMTANERFKEIRKLKKKLEQIEVLKRLQADGTPLNVEQKTKIALRTSITKDLERLQEDEELEKQKSMEV